MRLRVGGALRVDCGRTELERDGLRNYKSKPIGAMREISLALRCGRNSLTGTVRAATSVPVRPVHERGKTHVGTCDNDRRHKGDPIVRITLQPSEELGNAIDLIVVTTKRKRQ